MKRLFFLLPALVVCSVSSHAFASREGILLFEALRPDTIPQRQPKPITNSTNLLEKKATGLEYNSNDPNSLKKPQFTREDLKSLDLDSLNLKKPKLSGLDTVNTNKHTNKVNALQNQELSEDRITQEASQITNQKDIQQTQRDIQRTQQVADSAVQVKERIDATNLDEELSGQQRVYSEKYVRKVYDSLGVEKADSIFQVVNALRKTETSKQELLDKVNSPVQEKTKMDGMSVDEENQSLKMDDADKLNGLPGQATQLKDTNLEKLDLNSLQLPADLLAEMEPLKGKLTDSKYMSVIDSMKQVRMMAQNFSADEKQATEEVKTIVLKEKPSFLDKSYFEGILGFVNDSTLTIVQFSPAWAYHFTDNFSIGLGPNVALQYSKDKLFPMLGFRSFVKHEFWKQRVYAQVEDNYQAANVNKEELNSKTNHSILVGGGGILPLSKKLGVNASILYRINQSDVRPGGSPWVFRIGLSSIKKPSKKVK